MRKTARRRLRQAMALCLAALLLAAACPALGELDTTLWLTGRYQAPGAATARVWKFPYDDEMFRQPADGYQHDLAQATLGMALSAFRQKDATAREQGRNVRNYLTQAGFTALVSADYDQVPTIDTVSTVIASKRIDDFTLVAVAVCGGNYTDEWLSNFTIGDEQRHVGFNSAAQKVEARIRAYLEEQGITGGVKLWTGGYSRGAAIANLTAADMTDSGLFDAVYAYCYATPRVTKQPGSYANIFNILGKFDPVPLVPTKEWGYERNGAELYTPAQETDSNYMTLKTGANAVSQDLTGAAMFNNVEINNTLHTILDYLLTILPTSRVYRDHMQDIMLEAWRHKDVGNISSLVLRLMDDEELLNDDQRMEMKQLLDYLSVVTYSTVMGGAEWNAAAGLTENLAHEHVPDVYVSWMFSTDDPAQLFSQNDSFMRLIYVGSCTATLIDEGGHFVLQIDPEGRVSYSTEVPEWEASALPLSKRPSISCIHKGTQTILSLPRDQIYLVALSTAQATPLTYYGAEYQIDRLNAQVTDISYVEMEPEEYYIILSLPDDVAEDGPMLLGSADDSITVFDRELAYSPSLMAVTENMNVFHLTFPQMLLVVAGALVLVMALIVLVLVLWLKLRKRDKQAALAAAQAASALPAAASPAQAAPEAAGEAPPSGQPERQGKGA